jgi:hypothetical protein
MPPAQDDERPTPAELAGRIETADRPSHSQPERLRFQWNVPRGVRPHVPFWLSMLFLALLVVMIIDGWLAR